jgi:hypothetical protein
MSITPCLANVVRIHHHQDDDDDDDDDVKRHTQYNGWTNSRSAYIFFKYRQIYFSSVDKLLLALGIGDKRVSGKSITNASQTRHMWVY